MQNKPSSDLPIWNYPSAIKRLNGRTSDLNRLCQLMINELKRHAQVLNLAHKTFDPAELRNSAQKIRITAASLGCERLEFYMTSLETAAKLDTSSARQTIAELISPSKACITETLLTLKEHLSSPARKEQEVV